LLVRGFYNYATGDEERSINTAQRLFGKLTGFTPEESSFYARFTDSMLALRQRILSRLLDGISSVQRDVTAGALGGPGTMDILAVDATKSNPSAARRCVTPCSTTSSRSFMADHQGQLHFCYTAPDIKQYFSMP
jgi:hypothetical protein